MNGNEDSERYYKVNHGNFLCFGENFAWTILPAYFLLAHNKHSQCILFDHK